MEITDEQNIAETFVIFSIVDRPAFNANHFWREQK